MTKPGLTLTFASLALVVAAAALVVALASSGETASAGDSWRALPGLGIGTQLDYLRVDGRDFKVGEDYRVIEVVGTAGPWLEIEFTHNDKTKEAMWVFLENIQLHKVGEQPKRQPGSDDNSNSGG